MPSHRQLCGFLLVLLSSVGSTEGQLLSWKWLHPPKKPVKTHRVRPGNFSSLLHTQARFLYAGKVLAPVDSASAVLYDSTSEPDDVPAITSGAQSTAQAQRVCGAYVPGIPHAVGPGGDIYFDFVPSGDYWILVCAKVKFSGMANPVWVAGTLPISRQEFTEDTLSAYDIPRQVQIVLDPYAHELKAAPEELSANIADPPVDLSLRVVPIAPR